MFKQATIKNTESTKNHKQMRKKHKKDEPKVIDSFNIHFHLKDSTIQD